jgi:hypothetical protein
VESSPWKFGVVGIAAGQTLRVNVANVAFPPDPMSPTCMAEVSFRMSDGSLHGTPSRHTLAPGEAGFVDLTASDVGILGPPTRVQVRAILMVGMLPRHCKRLLVPSLEIFDDATGKTMVLYPPESFMGLTPALAE